MANRLNYDKKPNRRYTSAKSQALSIKETNYSNVKSTDHMLNFNKFLVDLCNEYGIEAQYADPELFIVDRKTLGKFNERLIDKLTEKGIKFKELWNSKNKYKFDKDGNVIDIATGKIVKRRDI